jgi:hypothetical protein
VAIKEAIKIICFLSLIIANLAVSGQQQRFVDFKIISAPKISITKSYEKNFVMMRAQQPQFPSREAMEYTNGFIRADHYTRNFGFFCKEELQIQKRTGVNFSLRLGTLDYCNFLEGKTNAINVSY